jgi:flagellar basal body-associated protein FliL
MAENDNGNSNGGRKAPEPPAERLGVQTTPSARDIAAEIIRQEEEFGHTPPKGYAMPRFTPVPDEQPAQEGPAAKSSARWGMFAVIAVVALAAIGGIAWAAVAGAQAAEASTTAKATALDVAAVKEAAKANAADIKKQQEAHEALEARMRLQEQTAAATLNALQNLKETTARIEAKLDAKK